MNKNQILKTDIIDIVFENRNKAYGAYELRKHYPVRIKRSLGIMFLLAVIFGAITFLPEKHQVVISRQFEILETELTKAFVEPEKPEIKPLPEPPAETVQSPASQRMFVNNLLLVNDHIKTDSIKTLLPDDVIGSVNIDVPAAKPALVQPVQLSTTAGTGDKPMVKTDKTTPIDLESADVPPVFPGGMDALRNFLQKNLRNPYDLENGEAVLVQVKFVVGYNGKLQNFTTVVDGGEIYTKEVMRVLKKMPDWQPGKSNGESVSVYYTIPVKFVMSD